MFVRKLIAYLICLIPLNVFAAVTVTVQKDINFGDVLPIGVPATLTVHPDGSFSDPQGIVLRSNRIQPASFVATSTTTNVDLYISTPTSFTLSNGINTLTVTNITDSAGGIYQLIGKRKKRATFSVGGTVNIPGGYISGGDYTGTLIISVDY